MKHVPIVGKFLTVFALFGVFALGIAAYSAIQIKSIDTAYSDQRWLGKSEQLR